ncbi:hypothetical protein TWF703_007578 [Orbilia oligospora]|uniref:Uncharacterized protein n=1 Tax=Orbilia oligospora TaxID=2813651 RepID=A0A7C8NRI1_ORBOL|nr:hypothetical protein TWF703_007578 [Orbilia oligospora]
MSSMNFTHVVTGAAYPPAGKPITAVLIMTTITVLTFCLTQRIMIITSWRKLTPVRWYILFVYIDSFLFIFSVGVISLGFGVNRSTAHCSAAIIMCIVFYETTKSRDRSFGMLVPYVAICFLTLAFRFSFFEDGVCRIGMKKVALLPLITFDVVVNVYLTTLFLIPVVKIAQGKAQQSHQALRSMAIKTFCGSCATLISSVANLTTLMLLKGEPGWICLLLCNADILFSAVVLHAITNKDHQGSSDTTRATNDYASQNDTTIIGNATDLGTRRSSIARGHKSSTIANTGFIGLHISPTFENDTSGPSSEKSINTSKTTEQRGIRSTPWPFRRDSRGPSNFAELPFDRDPADLDQNRPQRTTPEALRKVSVAAKLRPIVDYAEYDSDGLDFVTSRQVAEDLQSIGESGHHALSNEDMGIHHKKHEEQVPHRIV